MPKTLYMKLLNYLIVSLATCVISGNLNAQELNCSVVVNAELAQSVEKSVFKSMEASLASFLNETKWTNDSYQAEERIKCNIIIYIQEIPHVGNYSATVQIVSA